MKIVFITRAFPPAVGGMQAYAYHLYRRFLREHRVELIALSKGPRHIVWFAPWATARGLATAVARKVDVVYVGDAVMAPVGLLVGLARPGAIRAITVHGLDLTYPNGLYQAVVRFCLPRFDRVIANSGATARVALERGVPSERLRVIPCGVLPAQQRTERAAARRALASAGIDLGDRTAIVTVGRLVRRKGVAWFIEQVLPRLPEDTVFVVAGSGPELEAVRSAAATAGDRVLVLGRASDRQRDLLLDAADVFVMPNIRVPGDMEGFGIVALEAGVRGLPVVASRLEGIVDAIVDEVTGMLVEPEAPQAFADGIARARRLDRDRIPGEVLRRCHWDRVYEEYVDFLGAPSGADRDQS